MSKISDLGERRVIELLIENLDVMPDMPVPFGDDVSAIRLDKKLLAVLKTDMLVAKTDMPPGMSLCQSSRKAVVMNISDLAAKGVKPLALLTSLGLPSDFNSEDVEEIAKGLNEGAREYGAYVIGGDTGEASDLVICCTAFGLSLCGVLIQRRGARSGDIVAVTGTFGNTASGLKMLIEKLEAPTGLRELLLKSVYNPKARLKVGLEMARIGAASSSIDSSDGLAISLHELRKRSNVGFNIEKLPISYEAKLFAELHGLNAEELALYGGEEYELLYTIKPDLWVKAKNVIAEVGGHLIPIGKVTSDKRVIYRREDTAFEIPYRGWEHFTTKI